MCAKIIIITDSRGYGLENYIIQKKALEHPFQVTSVGGLTLRRAAKLVSKQEAIAKQKNLRYFYCIFAGICSFTNKDRYTGVISYQQENREYVVADALETIDELYSSYGGSIVLATIPPANIAKANSKTVSDCQSQQDKLETDIDVANKRILELNGETGVISIQTHKHILRTRKRDQKAEYYYKELTDGTHPSPQLEIKHFRHICNTINNQLKLQSEIPPLEIAITSKDKTETEVEILLSEDLPELELNTETGEGSNEAEWSAEETAGNSSPPPLELDTSGSDCFELLNLSQTSQTTTTSEEDTGNFKRFKH